MFISNVQYLLPYLFIEMATGSIPLAFLLKTLFCSYQLAYPYVINESFILLGA